ncbi:MAG: 50S ribosomal protein L13 [Candidatus ainarchaeum sp.]|nr:50S ribosomal protein L13 [Candidatus ainarchaeum sp.]
MLVDAKGLVAGRLASNVAKAAINNEDVVIVNASEAIIVGNKEFTLSKYLQKRDVGVKSNPYFGPKFDRIPSKMLRRMVKGMLPNKQRTKESIIKKVMIYNDCPKEFVGKEFTTLDKVKFNEKHNFITIGELAKLLGGKW